MGTAGEGGAVRRRRRDEDRGGGESIKERENKEREREEDIYILYDNAKGRTWVICIMSLGMIYFIVGNSKYDDTHRANFVRFFMARTNIDFESVY